MRVTHIATRSKHAGKALFQLPQEIEADQIEALRVSMTREITKELKERPSVVLIGIEGSKK
jgi:ribosomal protein L16/L10AE